MNTRIPEDFVPYIGARHDPSLKCEECGGYTAYASVIGIVGKFCSCPFDHHHP